jgi:hypothetical protein
MFVSRTGLERNDYYITYEPVGHMLRNSRGITPRNNIFKDTFWGIAGTVSCPSSSLWLALTPPPLHTDCHADLEDALGGRRSEERRQAAGRAQVVDGMLNVHVTSSTTTKLPLERAPDSSPPRPQPRLRNTAPLRLTSCKRGEVLVTQTCLYRRRSFRSIAWLRRTTGGRLASHVLSRRRERSASTEASCKRRGDSRGSTAGLRG